jgi:hypothetical protein
MNAAVSHLTGYSYGSAPAIPISGSANDPSSPHGIVTDYQKNFDRGPYPTLGQEFAIGWGAMREAGINPAVSAAGMPMAGMYFYGYLGHNPLTPTRSPGR